MAAGQQYSSMIENNIYEVNTKPFFIGRKVLADAVGSTCHVVVTVCGDHSRDKLTLRPTHNPHENEVEIKADDVFSVSYWDEGTEDLPAYVHLLLRQQKLFDKVNNMAPEATPGRSCSSRRFKPGR